MAETEQQQAGTSSPYAAPQISLPKGGGAIRGLGEKFQTNPANGTGTFVIPVPVSKSRGEFQPALTLAYSSGSGNGPYGLGWAIELPSISRRTDKGVPRYLPFARRARDIPLTDAGADIFLLSGSEDLVPVAIEDGPWIAHRVVGDYFVRGYRPRIEGTFARIESWTRVADGDTHWRTITRGNVLTVYGEGPESRIADPEDPHRVFTWLVCRSYDDRGNAIEYDYAAEGDDGIDTSRPSERFRSRGANRYLKRVRYGNRQPLLLDLAKSSARSCHLPRPHLDSATGWLFEVVVDYGDEPFVHEREADGFERVRWADEPPRPRLSRLDPFSASRAGFEIRTYRLCRRILMAHRMPETLGEPRTLVRAVHLEYEEKPNGTRLARTTHSAYRRLGDGSYRRKSLPSVLLHYSASPLDDPARRTWAVQDLPQESVENLPAGIVGSGYQWVDLDGEGIAGVVTARAGAWFYKPNRGHGRFGPVQVVGDTPRTEGGRSQLMDLDADGRLEYAALAPGTGGFFDRTADAGWTPFRPFRSLPIVDFSDPNVRLADLSGDGLADILITDDDAITWHPSLGDGGFGEAIRVRVPWNDDGGPRVLLGQADQSVFLADMSGDGLTDLVRIRSGEVCYWQNLGHGRFGPKITMDGSPCFDEEGIFDARRLRLADTDGSGPTDLIYAGRDGVRVFLNESGNALSTPRCIDEMVLTDAVSLDVVDLLGRGTACLVWSTALPGFAWRPVRYIDLMCGAKPHLLVRWENQLGVEMRLNYASSTEFYLADREAGRPWATRLPFPVHVVESVETIDHVSRNRFVSAYRYHHGHYDGVEREFRGFGMVEQIDSEHIGAVHDAANWDPALRLPPVLTKTWFHTGHYDEERRVSRHFAEEYYREADQGALLPDTIVPAGLTLEETREACRALKGTPLRREIYALDDSPASRRPYNVSETNYTIRLLQSRGGRRYAIFHTHARESVTLEYERKLYNIDGRLRADPRIVHQLRLSVDAFGNVLESVSIAYGRRYTDSSGILTAADHARQKRILVTYSEGDYSNAVSLPDAYRAPLPATARIWELGNIVAVSCLPHATALFRLEETRSLVDTSRAPGCEVPFTDWRGESAPNRGPYRRLLDHQRHRYRSNRLDALLPLGRIESLALPGERYALVFPHGLIGAVFAHRASETTAALVESGGYVDVDSDGSLWRPSGRVFYTATEAASGDELAEAAANFFVTRRVRDAFGHETQSDLDAYRLLVVSVTDALGNRNAYDYDYRILEPFRATDINGNRVEVAFDTLGMVAGTAVMGKVGELAGDSLEGFAPDLDASTIATYFADPVANGPALLARASSRVVYDVAAFSRDRSPPAAGSIQRETHDADLGVGDASRIQQAVTYSDGFGRQIQSRLQAEPGDVAGQHIDRRWTASGWTIFNNRGKPVRQYEPFYSSTHRFEFDARHGVSPTLVYDPVGRVVATLKPNGTFAKVVYEPWRQERWDDNDTTLLRARADPDIGSLVNLLPETRSPSWHDQRIDGALGPEEQDAAVKAAVHADTPTVLHFDAIGRAILTVAHNRSRRDGAIAESWLTSRVALDIEGAVRQVEDALRRTIMRSDYDLAGARIHTASSDAGERWEVADAAGNPLIAFGGLGHRAQTTYDALRRPVGLYVREPDGAERLAEQTVYGEAIQDATTRNLRGKPVQLRDAAGVVVNEGFDFKGNLLSSTRELCTALEHEPDWRHPPNLEPTKYASRSSFDALNRPTALTLADRSVIRPIYDEGGRLDRVELQYKAGDVRETIIAAIDYNAKAQRERVRYSNGVSTQHVYDPLTFRLTRTCTTRHTDGARLQDLTYTFDPAGNITSVRDAAVETVHFRNQAVDGSSRYEYDALYRLISATGREHACVADLIAAGGFDIGREHAPLPSDRHALRRYREQFTYDAVGNLLELLHAADGNRWRRVNEYGAIGENNRLTVSRIGSTEERFSYDAHGNTVAMSHLPQMKWNFRDQLAFTRRQAVEDDSGAATHYVYDAAGQRVRKVTVSESGAPLRDRIYLGLFELEREIGGVEGIVERDSLHIMDGARRVALVESREGARTVRFQLTDHLDSCVLELDDAGAPLSREEFYPFGETSYFEARAGIGRKRYRYTGMERDKESGLVYHRLRYCAPWLGRWVSPDPAGLVDGANLYAYVRNNPMRYSDPTGTQGTCDPTTACCVDAGLESVDDQAFTSSSFSADAMYCEDTSFGSDSSASSSSSADHGGVGVAATLPLLLDPPAPAFCSASVPDAPAFTSAIPDAPAGTNFSNAAARARQAFRAANPMPPGTQVQHWTKELSAAATNMDPAVMNQNLSPLQSRNARPATTLLVDPNGGGTRYIVSGGSTFGNEHKFADRFLIPQIEDQIRAANPHAPPRQVAVEAGRQARWIMTGEPGPAPVRTTPNAPASPRPRIGGGVPAGGAITAALWVYNIYCAIESYEYGSRPNTPAPVGDGMIGGSEGEAVLNAVGTLGGGAPVGTMLRQAAEVGSTGSDLGKVWDAIWAGDASPVSIGMGMYMGSFR